MDNPVIILDSDDEELNKNVSFDVFSLNRR